MPAATALERNDIACSTRDRMIGASHRIAEPAGEARTDYAIFSGIAAHMGAEEAFTEGRDEEQWLRHLYTVALQRVAELDMELPISTPSGVPAWRCCRNPPIRSRCCTIFAPIRWPKC
ncbi:MAG: hypothetical protein WDN48_10155 [Pseudolabrys sp.]